MKLLRLLILSAIVIPCFAAGPPTSTKRVLIIVHSDSCGPCREFDRMYLQDGAFRKALHNAFDLRAYDADDARQWALARQLGVTRVPSFVTHDARGRWRPPIVGFNPKNPQLLLTELGVSLPAESAPAPEITAPVPSPPDPKSDPAAIPPSPVATIDQEARGRIELISRTQQKLGEEISQIHSTLNQSLQKSDETSQAVQSVNDRMQTLTEELSSSRSDTRTEIQSLSHRMEQSVSERLKETVRETLREHISTEIPFPPANTTAREEPAGDSVAGGLLRVGLTGLALYFGLPVTGAGIAAAAIGWAVRRRRARNSGQDFRRTDGSTASAGTAQAGTCETPLPRELDEARELLRLRQREGRHPLHDALFGMLADTEFDNAVQDSSDPATAAAAVRLRDRITQRFNTIAPLSTHQEDYVQ